MEQLEKERDILQRANEVLKQDIDKTKDNMSHYRNSCQKLSKELEFANSSMEEIQHRYDMLLRKEDEKHLQRMYSGSSLGGLEDQLEQSEEDNQNVETQDQEMQEDNLGDELNELEGFDHDQGLIEGDFEGDVDGNDGIIGMENSDDEIKQFDNDEDNNYNNQDVDIQNENLGTDELNNQFNEEAQEELAELIEENNINQEIGVPIANNQNKSAHDFELQTELIETTNRRNQTPVKELIENDMQTDEIVKELYTMHTQTEESRKIF
jgi:hypothetical protein